VTGEFVGRKKREIYREDAMENRTALPDCVRNDELSMKRWVKNEDALKIKRFRA
jgi:hypothetical protein